MGYRYIGRALATISRLSCETADWAACRLTVMREPEIFALNLRLDYGLLAFSMRKVETYGGGAQRPEIADWRRAVELLQRLSGANASASFDEQACREFVMTFNAPAQPSRGVFLRPSFWAFASSNERAWTMAAWREAMEAMRCGLRTAMIAQQRAGASRTLVERWFGAGQAGIVAERLRTILTNANSTLVGICYEGIGAGAAGAWTTRLREFAGDQMASEVRMSAEWGWSAPQGATHQSIGFGAMFFNENTRKCMVRVHDASVSRMDVTRGGAVVHELSHRLGKTLDVMLPDTVYQHSGKALPKKEKERKVGYGTLACATLGQVEPTLATKNADNYRLFCEEAVYTKPAS